MESTKLQARERIKKLIEKYERVKKAKQIRRYDESNTRKDFIMPLFQALSWDVYNDFTDREVVEEETAVKGKVDYSFRVNNIPQFLLEAKALKEDLDKLEWAKQAVTYGWNKGIPWVVLTDFESLKLFNSEWQVETPRPNLEFTYDEFLKRLDDLWFLSRESIEKSELDRQAEKWGIKARRLKVTEKLAADLLKWRELLYKVFRLYNKDKSEEEINESVQRVLDRFIFIRVCEDRQLEEKILWQTLQTWITHDRKPHNFMQALRPIFKEFDKNYNSNLFQEHLCDRLDTEGTPFEQIINDLYADKEKGVKYNFSAIPADVLGTIYEQYLGYIQEKGVVNGAKRKKQGIYYTPEFIVDYIVQNTLGVALKEKPLREIENIKILDPACGSGSFLIKAFNLLDEKLAKEKAQEKSGPQAAFRKFNILRNNIYGVDLDSQAIEIARLNLLLKALEPNHKLPLLDNTKVGNSLISGKEKELREIFGKEWQEKKPFNWTEEFPEVFKQGGFDVIIGNPPYVSFYSRESLLDQYKDELNWLIANYSFTQKYQDRRLNTVMFFLERGFNLLKVGGYLGFIVDANFIEKPFRAIRKFIDDSNVEIKISKKISVFEDVGSDQVIVIFRKQESKNRRPINIIDYDSNKKQFSVLKEVIDRSEFRNDMLNLTINRIALNMQHKLSDITDVSTGVQIGIGGTRIYKGEKIVDLFYRNKQAAGFYKNVSLYSKDFFRYSPVRILNYINLNERLAYEINKLVAKCNIAVTKAEDFKDEDKIFIRQSSDRIVATLGYRGQVCEYSAFMLKTKNPSDLKYVLALLNSRLLSFYALQENIILTGRRKQPQIRVKGLKCLPLPPKIPHRQKTILSAFAQQMLKLNKDLQKCAKDSDRYRAVQAQIEKVNKQINQLVYKLYGLTPEEIRIVEEKTK